MSPLCQSVVVKVLFFLSLAMRVSWGHYTGDEDKSMVLTPLSTLPWTTGQCTPRGCTTTSLQTRLLIQDRRRPFFSQSVVLLHTSYFAALFQTTNSTASDLTKLLKDHYNPPPSKIVQRFYFNSRTRRSSELIADYIAALKDLARHCDYGDGLK